MEIREQMRQVCYRKVRRIERRKAARPFLQAVQHDARPFRDRLEMDWRAGTVAVVGIGFAAGPDDADTPAAVSGPEQGTDRRRRLVGQVEVGNLGGNAVERRVEDSREAQQREMRVESGQGVARCNDLVNATRMFQQPRQGGLAFHDNPAAALLHHRRIADEMNGVAEPPLLGVQQYAASIEVRAVPERLAKGARRKGSTRQRDSYPLSSRAPDRPLTTGAARSPRRALG